MYLHLGTMLPETMLLVFFWQIPINQHSSVIHEV